MKLLCAPNCFSFLYSVELFVDEVTEDFFDFFCGAIVS